MKWLINQCFNWHRSGGRWNWKLVEKWNTLYHHLIQIFMNQNTVCWVLFSVWVWVGEIRCTLIQKNSDYVHEYLPRWWDNYLSATIPLHEHIQLTSIPHLYVAFKNGKMVEESLLLWKSSSLNSLWSTTVGYRQKRTEMFCSPPSLNFSPPMIYFPFTIQYVRTHFQFYSLRRGTGKNPKICICNTQYAVFCWWCLYRRNMQRPQLKN